MSLSQELEPRDWFAGQALIGILMNPNTPKPEDLSLEQFADGLAEVAYTYAEAMMRERGRRTA